MILSSKSGGAQRIPLSGKTSPNSRPEQDRDAISASFILTLPYTNHELYPNRSNNTMNNAREYSQHHRVLLWLDARMNVVGRGIRKRTPYLPRMPSIMIYSFTSSATARHTYSRLWRKCFVEHCSIYPSAPTSIPNYPRRGASIAPCR